MSPGVYVNLKLCHTSFSICYPGQKGLQNAQDLSSIALKIFLASSHYFLRKNWFNVTTLTHYSTSSNITARKVYKHLGLFPIHFSVTPLWKLSNTGNVRDVAQDFVSHIYV